MHTTADVIYVPESTPQGASETIKRHARQRNLERLREIDRRQRQNGELLGRVLIHTDMYAGHNYLYQVIKVNPTSVVIRWCKEVDGNTMMVDLIGEVAVIQRETAEKLADRLSSQAEHHQHF